MNVCNNTDLPELEIISLLEEQLPVYKLRADTIYGYEQDDWLHTPLVAPDAALDLTTEQIEETLKYFLLCADRVGQMTKTYSDIDAVTRLLEEKERDLELAARIGQSLLKKNKTLSDRNELLEEQVEHIREEVSQLRHDLSMKDELLQFYTSAAEESEGESVTSTPARPSENNVSTPTFFPIDSLQKKLKELEEENKSLRSEASHLETETISYEEKEQQLVNDCVKELRNSNLQISSLSEELAKKTDDASRQQEEITHLLSQIVDLQKKAKLYAVENEELTQHLGAAKDAQRQLTAELRELQDKYAECLEILHEAQEELKNFRNKSLPPSTTRRFHSLGQFPMDSLAAEIEGTMRKELQMDDPDVEEQRLQPKRVFQTVKNLNLMRQQRSSLAPSPLNIPGSNQTSCLTSGRSSRAGTPRSNSIYGGEAGSGIILDNKTSSILESPDDGSEDSNKRPPGTPGTPGSRDLEAALRRLSLRRDNYLSEKRFFEEERERKLAYLAKEDEKGSGENSGGPATPTESLFSLCSHPSLWSGYSFTARSYLPEKLQIVKPLEGDYPDRGRQHPPHTQTDRGRSHNQSRAHDGRHHNQFVVFDTHSPTRIYMRASRGPQTPRRSSSLLELSGQPSLQLHLGAPLALVAGLLEAMEIQGGSATLHAWQQLAQPHMGALLDDRPGVVTKGFRTLEHDQEQREQEGWQLDQPEEDELSCIDSSFSGLPGEQLCFATSTPSARSTNRDVDGNVQLGASQGEVRGADEPIPAGDGRDASMPPPLFSGASPSSSPLPSSSEMNGHVDLKELQALRAGTMDRIPVNFPGKCMSHTSSTYTFTTCRILHPSDQLTTVSASPSQASCLSSSSCNGAATPISSPVPFSAPPTPSYTPSCTPRRLSLSFSLAESSTNLRDSTKTTSTSLGLVRLLLEHGISASVYDPCSWDRGVDGSGAATPGGGPPVGGEALQKPVTRAPNRPSTLALQPSTPPNSPRLKAASSTTPAPLFFFSPSGDDPPFYQTFLASKPARTILREVLGEAEREAAEREAAEDGGQTDALRLRLVDKLRCFRTLPSSSSSSSSASSAALLASFGPTALGLNAGLRRNRSYPAMVGASMAMKDPGGPPPSTDMLMPPHAMQEPQGKVSEHAQEGNGQIPANGTFVAKAVRAPQTLNALESVTPQTIVQRHARPDCVPTRAPRKGPHSEGKTKT